MKSFGKELTVNYAELYGKLCEAVDHAGLRIETDARGLLNVVPKQQGIGSVPDATSGNGKPKVRLENWFVLGNCAFGDVHDHPRLGTVKDCKTSKILNQSDTEIETLNTIYKLGTPHKDFL